MAGSSDVPPLAATAEPVARPESDDRYRQFLALSGNAIARFTLDQAVDVAAPPEEQVALIARYSRIADCNDLFARLYDRVATALVGRLLPELMPQDDPRRFDGIRQFVRAGYRLVDGEEVHHLEDGSKRWVNGSALGVVQDGRLLSYWLTLTDITARKQAEEDRERQGRILEAVAFGAAQLLEPGRWPTHIDLALERLGRAVDVSRIGLTRNQIDSDGVIRGVIHAQWTAPGVPWPEKDVQDGIRWQDVGLGGWQDTMRQGQPRVAIVSRLAEEEQALFKVLGTKSVVAVPILTNGQWWGVLAIHQMDFERHWSGPEIEAFKAGAAVFAAAIERKRAEEAIRESEERFERLAAAAFEGIAITEGGVFIDANEQLGALFGYEVAELVGREVAGFVADEDRDRVASNLRAASEEPYQHQARRRDGSVFPVEVRARALPHRGRTVRVSAIRDVSERVMAEERQRHLEAELRQAAEEWRQTFDALDLGIVLADVEGRIVRLNRTARDFQAGSTFADAVGRNLEDLADREPWRTVLQLHGEVGESRPGGSSPSATSPTSRPCRASSDGPEPWRPWDRWWREWPTRCATRSSASRPRWTRSRASSGIGRSSRSAPRCCARRWIA